MKSILAALIFTLCFVNTAISASVPEEGAIWDKKGVNARGEAFQVNLMIRHEHLIMVLPRGGQLDLGAVRLNAYNEYEVPPALFRRAWPAISTMTFKFSADFKSVTETDVMDYQGRCVAGDCANNVSTGTYYRR